MSVVAWARAALRRSAPEQNTNPLACWWAGDPDGADAAADEAIAVLTADEPEHACRAYVNLIRYDLELLHLDDARRRLPESIEFVERSDFVMFSRYRQVALGALHFATADWDQGVPAAGYALDSSPPVRCAALTLIGRTRLRRGEPGAVETLRGAWRIAVSLRECQWVGPAAAAPARGPAPAIRVDPAGLTERQSEVVRLLALGMTNAGIAGQLVLSEAVARACDLGVLDPRR
ncbi:hypothetical protein [Nonomuraea sp. NPDC050643]|uniref:LuxR C-terminal-related transcriptional regulator n=1 Tax=Nonomuraea sp. NPDC050643 TaxID=3155660 RepID=UPI00340E1FA2